jgi:hypothetical protein
MLGLTLVSILTLHSLRLEGGILREEDKVCPSLSAGNFERDSFFTHDLYLVADSI